MVNPLVEGQVFLYTRKFMLEITLLNIIQVGSHLARPFLVRESIPERRSLELNKYEGVIYSNREGIMKSVLRSKKYLHEKSEKHYCAKETQQ